ncbi:DegT/DnrJ/EryC1/StrS family aminotransferase [Loigolactobacillus iwatensis]|uniref:DegT/DnrJ/EryC1/StrS family aminotransferase n=1 Tax=Loigolactobacillus iwatensis TaxID=1267156 RepID=UPI000F7EBF12|nr:DegT/DnrJ/EryC1/StrS family aminotransferase [Loigolactobacillus iwatensis]
MSKKILVTESTMPSLTEYIEEITDLWQSKWLTNEGVKVQKLTKQLKNYLEVDSLSLVTNGHTALELALAAFDLHGGEVITTPFTFISTTNAICRAGLTPVFANIDPETFTLDPAKVEALITPRTKAILPVHIYGNACDVEAFADLATKYNLKLIYDGAHSFGTKYFGKSLGQFGDITTYSFHATKLFNTIEGGAIVANDEQIHNRLTQLKNFGLKNGEPVEIGLNGKMNEFSAAMGLCNLRQNDAMIEQRKMRYQYYYERLQNIPGIQLNPQQNGIESNAAYFPVLFHDTFGCCRETIIDRLMKQNIFPRKYFYPLTSESPSIQNNYPIQATPIAHDYAQRVLTLPLYPNLEFEIIDQICQIIIDSGQLEANAS